MTPLHGILSTPPKVMVMGTSRNETFLSSNEIVAV